MFIYRILLAKYGDKLIGSNRAARWNSDDVNVIYNASSRSLACLEIAVHRNQAGLNQLFNVLTVECPNSIRIKIIHLSDLPLDWTSSEQLQLTQAIGDNWIAKRETAILQVPSAIVNEETNYLLNPNHKDFALIKLVKVQPFVFDTRIKQV